MESTRETLWSRKRKLQAKMTRSQIAHVSPSASGDSVSPTPVTSERSNESSDAAHVPNEGISMTHEQFVSSELLDESLQVPVNAQLMIICSSESSDDHSSFTNDDAHHVYQEWLKEQLKHNVKVMAVMIY